MNDERYVMTRMIEDQLAIIKSMGQHEMFVTTDVMQEILAMLKGQEEQFIDAFNTIRDAYNTPANREKILLNYLLRNACCYANGEWKEG